MKSRLLIVLTCMLVLYQGRANAQIPLPGTPIGGGSFGAFDLFDGVNVLPGLVTPGDLVLNESPTAPPGDRVNWSNVVRFTNITTPFGRQGIAYHISDGEAGIPSILVQDPFFNTILPDTLSNNNAFRTEVQTGTGTEADVTPYQVPKDTVYNIHSDAPVNDVNENIPLLPGAVIVPPGPKGWFWVTLFEPPGVDNAFIIVPLPLVPGVALNLDPNGALSDTITFAPFGNGSIITLNSVADDNNSTIFDDVDAAVTVVFDEGGISYQIIGQDVPEPSAIAFLGTGALGLLGYAWRRRKIVL